jgi:hypothetical protein
VGGVETVLTLEDLHVRLRRAAERVEGLSHGEKYRSLAVQERDALISAALAAGMRPWLVVQDTGLSRARIYQIRAAAQKAEAEGELDPRVVDRTLSVEENLAAHAKLIAGTDA